MHFQGSPMLFTPPPPIQGRRRRHASPACWREREAGSHMGQASVASSPTPRRDRQSCRLPAAAATPRRLGLRTALPGPADD